MAMNSSALIATIKARATSELGLNFSKQTQTDLISIMIEETILHIQTLAVANTIVVGTLPPGAVAATGTGKIT